MGIGDWSSVAVDCVWGSNDSWGMSIMWVGSWVGSLHNWSWVLNYWSVGVFDMVDWSGHFSDDWCDDIFSNSFHDWFVDDVFFDSMSKDGLLIKIKLIKKLKWGLLVLTSTEWAWLWTTDDSWWETPVGMLLTTEPTWEIVGVSTTVWCGSTYVLVTCPIATAGSWWIIPAKAQANKADNTTNLNIFK